MTEPVSAASADAGRSPRRRFPAVCLLPALAFLLALAPVLPSGTPYHGDERFYTNGALQMLDSGDWLVPRWADGSPRLNKPPLTYWAVALSCRIFGVGLWQSRLPSAVAGAALVGLTAVLAWVLFRDRALALLAAWLAATNFQVQASAGRAIPDALLGAFLVLALVGFAGVLFPPAERGSRPAAAWAYLAWLALALATLAKGLLPLLLAGYVLVAAAAIPGLRARLRHLLRPGPMALATAVALAWYAAVLHRLGAGAFRVFWADQVGGRVGTGIFAAVTNYLGYLTDGAGDAAVAVLLVAVALASRRRHEKYGPALHDGERPGVLFLLGWLLVYVGVFSAANLTRGRYLLPAHPAVSVLLALVVVRSLPASAAVHRRLTAAVRWLATFLGLALLVVGVFLASRLPAAWQMTAGGALTLVAVAASVALGAGPPLRRLGGFLALVLFCSTVPVQAIRNGWREQPEPALVEALRAHGVASGPLPSWHFSDRTAARLRLASGGAYRPVDRELADLLAAPPATLLVEDDLPSELAGAYRLVDAGVDRQWRPNPSGLFGSSGPWLRETVRARYYLALWTASDDAAARRIDPASGGAP